jgi:RNA polymerase sigma-70 factor (ECF subfamily)
MGKDPQIDDTTRLAAQLAAGDVAALRAIMAEYWERLSTIALIITGSPDLAFEAVQDAFVHLWDARATIDATQGVAGYLKTITRRRAIDLRRHERMHTRIADVLAAYIPSTGQASFNQGETAVESAELEAQIREAIRALPERCREMFLLSRQGDMSYAEIAETLGVSVPTVRNQMSQATQRIARALARWRTGES